MRFDTGSDQPDAEARLNLTRELHAHLVTVLAEKFGDALAVEEAAHPETDWCFIASKYTALSAPRDLRRLIGLRLCYRQMDGSAATIHAAARVPCLNVGQGGIRTHFLGAFFVRLMCCPERMQASFAHLVTKPRFWRQPNLRRAHLPVLKQ